MHIVNPMAEKCKVDSVNESDKLNQNKSQRNLNQTTDSDSPLINGAFNKKFTHCVPLVTQKNQDLLNKEIEELLKEQMQKNRGSNDLGEVVEV